MSLDPWLGMPPHAEPIDLPGYSLARHERINMTVAGVLGLAFIPLWWILFALITSALGEPGGLTLTIGLVELLLAIPVFVATLAVHELIHGLAVLMTGNRPAFGVGPGIAYTTVHESLTKAQYVAIALAPPVVISAAAIAVAVIWPSLSGWALYASLINASGAGGDIWMAWRIAPLPSDARFVDLADGFAVYVPETSGS